MILDIHTHHAAPQPEGVISLSLTDSAQVSDLAAGQKYSIGFHPWHTLSGPGDDDWERLEQMAVLPEIVAIGECGLDLTPRGAPMFRQLQIFRRQAELSERVGKPLIIHNVKADDMIIGLHRDLKPTQPWVIHGFRRKPQVAEMLLRAGFMLSFGAEFNIESLRLTPSDRLLAETDESDLSIEEVIERLKCARGEELRDVIAANTSRILAETESMSGTDEILERI